LDRGQGSSKGSGPDRELVAPSRVDRRINVSNLLRAERLLLSAPEQWEIDSPGERLQGQIDRLAPLGDRLDDSRREKAERNKTPHRATRKVESNPPGIS
jgi:hypothetical protein